MSDPSSPANLREQASSRRRTTLETVEGATCRVSTRSARDVGPPLASRPSEGAILEEGTGRSTGGRRPRILRLRDAAGALSGLDVYVAAARSMLYERCLPSMTQSLSIEAGIAGPDAALTGLGHLVRAKADVRSS
ncbi:hypothetical protein [Nonomuraea recticatena]